MTGERFEIDPALPEGERAALARLAERLQSERPLPAPAFRGELRRRLPELPRAPGFEPRWRLAALSYAAAGLLCLAAAAAGLVGAGPFAA